MAGNHIIISTVSSYLHPMVVKMATINAPGPWHDSTMADYGVYKKMEATYNQFAGAKVVVDSAFKLRNKRFLIKSAQSPSIQANHEEIVLNNNATSLRQLLEHGMRMIQGQFPRLKDKLVLEEYGKQKVIMNLMVLL